MYSTAAGEGRFGKDSNTGFGFSGKSGSCRNFWTKCGEIEPDRQKFACERPYSNVRIGPKAAGTFESANGNNEPAPTDSGLPFSGRPANLAIELTATGSSEQQVCAIPRSARKRQLLPEPAIAGVTTKFHADTSQNLDRVIENVARQADDNRGAADAVGAALASMNARIADLRREVVQFVNNLRR